MVFAFPAAALAWITNAATTGSEVEEVKRTPKSTSSEQDVVGAQDAKARPKRVPSIDGSSQGVFQHVTDGSFRVSVPELYHRLQNTSTNPHALPLARRFLLATFSRVLESAVQAGAPSDPTSILSLTSRFDPFELETWLHIQHARTAVAFVEYTARRKEGGGREMFATKKDAIRWCRQSAVVKYVDGTWLQGTLRSTTGLELASQACAEVLSPLEDENFGPQECNSSELAASRGAARVCWQVLSEELGDGLLDRNHVHVYEKLVDSFASPETSKPTPKGDDADFLTWLADDASAQPNRQPWMAALLQLTLSCSPDEFLPEILGFNMSYEGLPLHLLISAKELKELHIDPYYFILHISIDNLHSGHSAMARLAVNSYLQAAKETHGQAVADLLWRRIQAGYLLADSVRTTPRHSFEPLESESDVPGWASGIPLCAEDLDEAASASPLARLSQEIIDMFKSKMPAAQGLHCTAGARIGGRPLSEWLTEEVMASEGEAFVRALSKSKPWVRAGEPGNSKLLKECQWGGRMFGSFTRCEVGCLREWINALPPGGLSTTDDISPPPPVLDLPSSTSLDATISRPYLDFVYSSAIEGDMQTALSSSAHFALSLQPLDFSSLLNTVASWNDWLRCASEVYNAILDRPNATRCCFSPDFNLATFLESLVKQEEAESFDISSIEDLIDPIMCRVRSRSSSPPRPPIYSEKEAAIDNTALLPIWYTSAAPLEWLPASSPAKLASPMGSAVVKILRCLHGLTEEGADDSCAGVDADDGCMGTDDVLKMDGGLWELGARLLSPPPDKGSGSRGVTLATFRHSSPESLALPALILLLNSQPTLHLPLLLGIALALNDRLHASPSLFAATDIDAHQRLADIASKSRRWLNVAIAMGFEAESEGKPVRGWEGMGKWSEMVLLGFRLGVKGLAGVRGALRTC